MTVRELIELLQEYPADSHVVASVTAWNCRAVAEAAACDMLYNAPYYIVALPSEKEKAVSCVMLGVKYR